MRILVTILIINFSITMGFAQVRPQLSMYMLNKYSENSAYAGMERSINVVSSYRDQFSTLLGNPRTFYISADAPLFIWGGGVGFSFQNSSAGLIDLNHIRASFNKVYGTKMGFLSVGARLGLQLLSIDGSNVITPEGNYESTVIHNDPFLDALPVNGLAPSWELSSYFYAQDFEVGLSIFDFPSHKVDLGVGSFRFSPHFSLIGQYKWGVSDDWDIRPNVLIKGQGNVWQTDISCLATFNKQTFGGVGLRGYNSTSLDAISVIFGTLVNQKTKIAYSYDFGLSSLGQVHQGSHEFTVSYNFQKAVGIGLPPKIIYNPRHL